MMGSPDWSRDGRDWPNRTASRFIRAGGLRWHVQVLGPEIGLQRPTILLLHGTGASTHSWRDLAPILAERFTVIAPDLPGHGFTEHPAAAQMDSAGMARLVAALIRALNAQPTLVVGHSAGAAIGARMMLAKLLRPVPMVSLNGALSPMAGAEGTLYPIAARLLANTPVVPWVFAMQARRPGAVDRLLTATGSSIDADGRKFYARLIARPGHVAGALRMMSRWDLDIDLAALHVPVTLVVGDRDGMVPPEEGARLAARLPQARVVMLPGLGHLAHEEQPALVARLVEEAAMPVNPRMEQAVTLADCA
jgi:magnesium chelatase accessory protein